MYVLPKCDKRKWEGQPVKDLICLEASEIEDHVKQI